MDQRFPRLTAKILQPDAFVVTVWLRKEASSEAELAAASVADGDKWSRAASS
jgi:hypothetical protein